MTQTIGIIGDGQLGMMLCDAAPALSLKTVMLTSNASGPAAQRAAVAIEGTMDDATALSSLVEQCDIITYEREDVPPAAIEILRAAEQRGAVRCLPRLDTIEIIQDKAKQKSWLAENNLATLPFVLSDGSEDAAQRAGEILGFPLVQKALRGGFDGRGVQVIDDPAALIDAWPGQTLFEKYAGRFTEVAVLVARREDGESTHFGPVDMTFETEHSVLDTVSAPSAASSEIRDRAVQLAHEAIDAMDGVGVFGVEMFVLENGEVLINEISPRVHNAGHYTLEACATSQFEQHLRAISGAALGSTEQRRPAAMRNILCTPPLQGAGRTEQASTGVSYNGATVYWYGKSPARLMRKLGHVTALADTVEEALAKSVATWEQIQQQAGEQL